MIAESRTEEKDTMVKVVVNLIKKEQLILLFTTPIYRTFKTNYIKIWFIQ